jgi:RimJ/RimL family protein N-acetyltransferase
VTSLSSVQTGGSRRRRECRPTATSKPTHAHAALSVSPAHCDPRESRRARKMDDVTISLAVPQTQSATALRLRPWRLDDLPALLAAHRDPVLRRRLTTSLADEAQAQQWLKAQAVGWKAAKWFSFAVVAEDDDQTPLGHVGMKVVTAGVAEVGYWTAAQARGQGIATRALETTSQWALRTQGLVRLTRLDLLHAENNPASCRVAEKCGYVLHDLLPPAPPTFPTSGHRHVRTPLGN